MWPPTWTMHLFAQLPDDDRFGIWHTRTNEDSAGWRMLADYDVDCGTRLSRTARSRMAAPYKYYSHMSSWVCSITVATQGSGTPENNHRLAHDTGDE